MWPLLTVLVLQLFFLWKQELGILVGLVKDEFLPEKIAEVGVRGEIRSRDHLWGTFLC